MKPTITVNDGEIYVGAAVPAHDLSEEAMTTPTPDEPLYLGEPDPLEGTFIEQIAKLKSELSAVGERIAKLEAERDSLKRHAEAMAEELQWIACRYDDSKSTRECAADAYEMKSAAAQALHAYRAAHQDGGAK